MYYLVSTIIHSSAGVKICGGLHPFEELFSTCSEVSNSRMESGSRRVG